MHFDKLETFSSLRHKLTLYIKIYLKNKQLHMQHGITKNNTFLAYKIRIIFSISLNLMVLTYLVSL